MESKEPSRSKDDRPLGADSSFGRYSSLGLTFAFTILIFGALGWWLDDRLGTTPLFLVVLILLGFGGGLISMIKRIPPARRRGEPRD